MIHLFKKTILIIILFCAFALTSNSQIVVNSTDGYSVKITINPTSLFLYNGSDCKYGYNYDINLDYSIELSGRNIPSNLYTLQGYIETADGSLFYNLPKNGAIGNTTTNGRAWTPKTDCESASLETNKIQVIKVQIEGPGIPSQFIIYSKSILPIELISFEAIIKNESVNVSWITATENNNDFFTVERSYDGINFEPVSKVKGAGNSNAQLHYSFLDSYIDRSVYYRLKQTDFDGGYHYSKVIFLAQDNLEADLVNVFPNPNHTNQISISAKSTDFYCLTILTISGQTLQVQNIETSIVTIPTLEKGFYIFQFKNKFSGQVQNVKYIQK